jgi:hypothetical protein
MDDALGDISAKKAAYTRIIAPFLDELSKHQHRLTQTTIRDLKYLAAAGVVGALILLPFSAGNENLSLLPPLLAIIIGGALVFRRQGRWQAQLASMALESVSALAPGTTYKLESTDASFKKVFEDAGLISRSTRPVLRFHLTGRYRDAEFQCMHAMLHSGSGKNRRKIFDGILAHVEMPRASPFQIVISPKLGTFTANMPDVFMNRQLRQLTPIEFKGHLAERFLVHAACQSEADAEQARALLTPQLQEALISVDTDEGHGGSTTTFAQLHAAFIADRLYLALPRQQVRKLGGVEVQTPKSYLDAPFYMNSKADLAAAFSDIFEDIMLIFRLIDRLR